MGLGCEIWYLESGELVLGWWSESLPRNLAWSSDLLPTPSHLRSQELFRSLYSQLRRLHPLYWALQTAPGDLGSMNNFRVPLPEGDKSCECPPIPSQMEPV